MRMGPRRVDEMVRRLIHLVSRWIVVVVPVKEDHRHADILRWGNITDEELAEHESSIRRWGVSSAVLNLNDRQLAALIERGRGWPWNGYELRLMKEAGKYPPARPAPHRGAEV